MQNNTHWDIYRETSKQGILFIRVHINTLLLQHFFLSQMQTYSKSLLTEISAKSTFRIGFNFKEVNIYLSIYLYFEIFLIYCYDYNHLPFLNKPHQPEMSFTENAYHAF